jgi:hypothetical protein
MRRLMLEAIHVAEKGGAPRGLDPAAHRAIRPHDRILPPGEDWRATFAQELGAKW